MMRIITRPLKAPTQPIQDFASLQEFFPLWASDKEDGIRTLICPQRGPITGQLKPIRNNWISELLYLKDAEHLDGELLAIDCEGDDCEFHDTQSAVMSREGQPAFVYRVFDCYENIYDPYHIRLKRAIAKVKAIRARGHTHFTWMAQTPVRSVGELENRIEDALLRGKEGLMLRNPNGWYKEGRSTENEAYLLKIKPFTDDEAVVIDIEEEMANCNPAKINERGLQYRSKHRAGLKGKGMVGKLKCKWKDKIIYIGSGFPELLKTMWWDRPDLIIGQRVTFKYQQHGMKADGLPRSPIFKSIRHLHV